MHKQVLDRERSLEPVDEFVKTGHYISTKYPIASGQFD
jgi:hypothetical protein